MFRAILNDKIGNIACFFSSHVPHLSLTKLLKLLYLTDEKAVRETSVPITWLEYRAWKNGPVPADIYQEIKHGEKMSVGGHLVSLDNYVRFERVNNDRRGQEEIYILANAEPQLGRFSDYEIGVLNDVLAKYGGMSAARLVEALHEKGSLWHQVVEKNNLEQNFALFQNTSNCIIDFSDLIEGDELLKMTARAAFDALYFQVHLEENQFQEAQHG